MNFDFIFQSDNRQSPVGPASVSVDPHQKTFCQLCQGGRTTNALALINYIEEKCHLKKQVVVDLVKKTVRVDEPITLPQFKAVAQRVASVQTSQGAEKTPQSSYPGQQLLKGDKVYQLKQEDQIQFQTKSFLCKNAGDLKKMLVGVDEQTLRLILKLVLEREVQLGDQNMKTLVLNTQQVVVAMHLAKKSKLYKIPPTLPPALRAYLKGPETKVQKPFLETAPKQKKSMTEQTNNTFSEVFKQEAVIYQTQNKVVALESELSSLRAEMIQLRTQHSKKQSEMVAENHKLLQLVQGYKSLCRELVTETRKSQQKIAQLSLSNRNTIQLIIDESDEVSKLNRKITEENERIEKELTSNQEFLKLHLDTLQKQKTRLQNLHVSQQKSRNQNSSMQFATAFNQAEMPKQDQSKPVTKIEPQIPVEQPGEDINELKIQIKPQQKPDGEKEDLFAAHTNFMDSLDTETRATAQVQKVQFQNNWQWTLQNKNVQKLSAEDFNW